MMQHTRHSSPAPLANSEETSERESMRVTRIWAYLMNSCFAELRDVPSE